MSHSVNSIQTGPNLPTSENVQMETFQELPRETIVQIVSQMALSPKDFMRISLTNKHMRTLCLEIARNSLRQVVDILNKKIKDSGEYEEIDQEKLKEITDTIPNLTTFKDLDFQALKASFLFKEYLTSDWNVQNISKDLKKAPVSATAFFNHVFDSKAAISKLKKLIKEENFSEASQLMKFKVKQVATPEEIVDWMQCLSQQILGCLKNLSEKKFPKDKKATYVEFVQSVTESFIELSEEKEHRIKRLYVRQNGILQEMREERDRLIDNNDTLSMLNTGPEVSEEVAISIRELERWNTEIGENIASLETSDKEINTNISLMESNNCFGFDELLLTLSEHERFEEIEELILAFPKLKDTYLYQIISNPWQFLTNFSEELQNVDFAGDESLVAFLGMNALLDKLEESCTSYLGEGFKGLAKRIKEELNRIDFRPIQAQFEELYNAIDRQILHRLKGIGYAKFKEEISQDLDRNRYENFHKKMQLFHLKKFPNLELIGRLSEISESENIKYYLERIEQDLKLLLCDPSIEFVQRMNQHLPHVNLEYAVLRELNNILPKDPSHPLYQYIQKKRGLNTSEEAFHKRYEDPKILREGLIDQMISSADLTYIEGHRLTFLNSLFRKKEPIKVMHEVKTIDLSFLGPTKKEEQRTRFLESIEKDLHNLLGNSSIKFAQVVEEHLNHLNLKEAVFRGFHRILPKDPSHPLYQYIQEQRGLDSPVEALYKRMEDPKVLREGIKKTKVIPRLIS